MRSTLSKRWLGFLLVVTLVLALLASTVLAASPDEETIRAAFAEELLGLAGMHGGDYTVDCGDANVLNTNAPLSGVYDKDCKAVCVLVFDDDEKAVFFAVDPATPPQKVINHFAQYAINAEDDDLILADDVNENACADPEQLENDWTRCINPIDQSDYELYMKPGEDTSRYLFTYGYNPPFDPSFLDSIWDFFRSLFGAEPTTYNGEGEGYEERLPPFQKGYFAHYTAYQGRDIKAFYTDMDGSGGRATIIFKNFATDFSTLADNPDDPESYMLGSDNQQVLQYKNIGLERWQRLTSALRIQATDEPPLAGDVCGNGVRGYDEECEGEIPNMDEGTWLVDDCDEVPGRSFIDAGTLACDTSTCMFDTSGCFACVDADNDGSPINLGLPEELEKVRGALTLGGLTLDTTYDYLEGTDYTNQQEERDALGIRAQAVPINYNDFFSGDAMNDSTAQLLTRASARVLQTHDECSCSGCDCIAEAFANENDKGTYDLLGGAVATRLSDIGPNGNADPSYNTLFEFLIGADPPYKPILKINIPADTPYQELIDKARIGVACGALVKGVQQELNFLADSMNADAPALDTHIMVSDGSPEKYFQYASFCQFGVAAAMPGAKVYYDVTPTGGADATNIRLEYLRNVGSPKSWVKGIATDDPEAFLNDNTYAALRDEMGADILTINNVSDPSALSPAAALMSTLRAGGSHLLFTELLPLMVEENSELTLTAKAAAVSAISLKLTGLSNNLYRPAAAGIPTLVGRQGQQGDGDTSILFNDIAGNQLPPLDLSDCDYSLAERLELNNHDHTAAFETLDAFDPDQHEAGIYLLTLDEWACFLENPILGACQATGITFDCNDTDEYINPNALEVCGDGIDNDCDGLIDEEEDGNSCVASGSGDITCNYNNIPEDWEDVTTCIDWLNMQECPTAGEDVINFTGYTLSVHTDSVGVPVLYFNAPDTTACALGRADTGSRTSSASVEWRSEDIGKVIGIYYNGGDHRANVSVEITEDGWAIEYLGEGSGDAASCWGGCGDTYDSAVLSSCGDEAEQDTDGNFLTIATVKIADFPGCQIGSGVPCSTDGDCDAWNTQEGWDETCVYCNPVSNSCAVKGTIACAKSNNYGNSEQE